MFRLTGDTSRRAARQAYESNQKRSRESTDSRHSSAGTFPDRETFQASLSLPACHEKKRRGGHVLSPGSDPTALSRATGDKN